MEKKNPFSHIEIQNNPVEPIEGRKALKYLNESDYISACGPHQSGKSTFSKYLRNELTIKPENIVVPINFQGIEPDKIDNIRNITRFINEAILDHLKKIEAIDKNYKLTTDSGIRQYFEIVSELVKQNNTLLLKIQKTREGVKNLKLFLFFDEITALDNSITGFLGLYRSIYNEKYYNHDSKEAQGGMLFTFPGNPTSYNDGPNSPFNITKSFKFESLYLKKEAFAKTIKKGFKKIKIEISDDIVDFIYEQTNGHPFLTMHIAEIMFEELFKNIKSKNESLKIETSFVEKAINTILEEDHLKNIVSSLNQDDKMLLKEIINGSLNCSIFAAKLDHLNFLGLLGTKGDSHKAKILNKVYEMFLKEYLD